LSVVTSARQQKQFLLLVMFYITPGFGGALINRLRMKTVRLVIF